MRFVTKEEIKSYSRSETKKEEIESKKKNSLELLVQNHGIHVLRRLFEDTFKLTN